MNDIELAYQIDTSVGEQYQHAFEARSLYKGSEVHFIRKALEAFVFNALDEYQLPICSNLHDNIEAMKSSAAFSEGVIVLCHSVRILCNQQLHFSFENNSKEPQTKDDAFDKFEQLLCTYFISVGGHLTEYERSKLDACDLKKAIEKIYVEEDLTSPQIASVAYYWYEKHKGERNPVTGQIDSMGNPFFLESAVALMKQHLKTSDDSLLRLYLCFLSEPALIDNHFEELYSIAELKVAEGDLEFLNYLNSVSLFTKKNVQKTADYYRHAYENHKEQLSVDELVTIYSYFSGLVHYYEGVQPDANLAKEALLTAVDENSSQALRFYATDLFKGLLFDQDFNKSYEVLKQLEEQEPDWAAETRTILQKQFQLGRISDSSGKAHTPISSTKSVGRNDACPCGSGKKYKKCCA
ncbi:SEC-C metal-binding domain-containing protein [Vibrio sp. B1Z05]|uniref:SEC-C metal-binding domain-containing protein n=1 Tax=Vibrio sp. B1Z05 TaxID=2654980 RepID=UPI00128CCF08|nr:SEC-C metal-binding domain-containing protein [Vibrio sp. B1Z05]MPW36349.1 hypothetical protein [Vibrio sp. B1Z05]